MLLPTLISAIYFLFIASDQYAVETRFSVRGANSVGTADILGLVTGTTSGGSTTSDSYILMDYLNSRPMIEQLNKLINLRQIYGSDAADYFSSLKSDVPIEEVLDYWKKMISINYDTTSQIIVLEARAFVPEDAVLVSKEVLKLSERLVNNLSEQERKDALSQANSELYLKQKELKSIRREITKFRDKEKIIDPSKTAESQILTQSSLEEEIVKAEAELRTKSQFLDQDSPTLKILRTKISSMQHQVEQERSKIGDTAGRDEKSISLLIQKFRDLLLDQEFAEKAVTSAMASVEAARVEANKRQRYLITFVEPTIPEKALYPKRFMNILITFIVSMLFWGIGVLVFYSVRDHAT